MSTGNITEMTPGTANAIASTVRKVGNAPIDNRARPNPANTISPGAALPPGGFKYQVLQRIDDGPGPSLAGGTAGWGWVAAHSAS